MTSVAHLYGLLQYSAILLSRELVTLQEMEKWEDLVQYFYCARRAGNTTQEGLVHMDGAREYRTIYRGQGFLAMV